MTDYDHRSSPGSDQAPIKLHKLLSSLTDITSVVSDADLELIELAQDELLFEQGDSSDSMYILMAGMLGVRVRHEDGTETVVDKLSPGAAVGEMGMLAGRPRSASIFALNPAGLIRIDKSGFQQLLKDDDAGIKQIAGQTAERWQRLQLSKVLSKLFGQLETAQLHAIQNRLEWISLSNGEELFRQDDPGDGMYIVVSGCLRVLRQEVDGEERTLGEVAAGDLVGEFSLLTEEARSATVIAVRHTSVAKMTPEDFQKLVHSYPQFMTILSRLIVERQLRSVRGDPNLRTSYLSLAIVPDKSLVDASSFARQLGDSMAGIGDTLVLDRSRFDELYGQEGASATTSEDPNYPAIVAWMSEQEAAYDYLIYVADAEYTTWSCHCLNQSDRVLILADVESGLSSPGPVENAISEMRAPLRTDLILWQPASIERPVGTADWLDSRHVGRHFHIQKEDPCHMQRLARQLTCRSIGLVLSGGGARGFSHIGVYQALEEVGIPLDHIGGTSIGSLMGAMFTLDRPSTEILGLALELADNKNIFDYTLPLTSLTSSKKITSLLQKLFGDLQIEDLWIPFFCVSSNLSKGEPIIHRRGPMWKAVRSSISIPGVFAPMVTNGEIIVDGSPMNNFPVDIMVEEAETRRIIGVLASPQESKRRGGELSGSISGWRILASRLNPFSKPIRSPSLISTVLRAMEVNSVYQNKTRAPLAELVIRPDTKRFSGLDFSAYKPIIEEGYKASIGPLQEWFNNQRL